MRRINLLPPEEQRRDLGGGLRGNALGILLIASALAVMIMVALYLFFLVRVHNEEQQIAQLDQQIAQQNQRLAELAPYKDLKSRLDAKKPVADGIYRTRFPWDEFLQGLSFVIPDTTALDTLTAKAAPINIQAPDNQALDPPGSVTFTGVSRPRYTDVADFVLQMNNLRFLANSQLNSAELDRQTFAPQDAINFEVAAELVTKAGENGQEVPIGGGTSDQAGESTTQASKGAGEQAASEGTRR